MRAKKFGTFAGVFTPSILTILGVIMYLRLPMIVGEAGLVSTLMIILVAHVISMTTGLSVSSIATDKKVQAGGTYYMISRSLGLPIGGTLGLALFVGLSFSVSLYLIGFSESFLGYFGMEVSPRTIRITGMSVLAIVTTITFISTSLAIRMQFFIMAAIALSLISLLAGKHTFIPGQPLIGRPESSIPLMVLFGIFFPAVTGFEAGVSMSGDLKDPKKSIPGGTIAAVVVGLFVYIALAFYFSYNVQADLLAKDPEVLLKISYIPQVVLAGIWGATLSSAFGSILGAPRILQATAVDRIVPRVFAKGVGPGNEPRNALLLSCVIASAGILIGELNVIARIVSIFFITTYGFLNLSCAFERWASADFRPEFKTPIWVSLTGTMACVIVMIQLDFLAMIGAIVILGGVFLLLKRKELKLESGDAWSGVWASLVKTGLEKLHRTSLHARNWRPNILLFGGAASRPHLMEVGKAVAGRLGMMTCFELSVGNKPLLAKVEHELSEQENPETPGPFIHKYSCTDIYQGIDEISRVYGFSGVEPNTILMGWTKKLSKSEQFISLAKNFQTNELNSMLLSFHPERGFGSYRTVDVWWSGWGRNLSFAINIVRFLSSFGRWENARFRLLVMNTNKTLMENHYRTLTEIVDQHRVDLEVKIADNSIDGLPYYTVIQRESGDSDLTIVGIPDSRYNNLTETYERANTFAEQMGTVLFINASSTFPEYELTSDESPDANQSRTRQQDLVPLPRYRFPVVHEEISRMDRDGLARTESYFDGAFGSLFVKCVSALSGLKNLNASVFRGAGEILESAESHLKNRAFHKVRNDFFFRANRFIDQHIVQILSGIRDDLESAFSRYEALVNSEIDGTPKILQVEHPGTHFRAVQGDSALVRVAKFLKRAANLFAETISVGVRLKELSENYLRYRPQAALNATLEQINLKSLAFISAIRTLLGEIDQKLSWIGRMPPDELNQQLLDSYREENHRKIEALEGELNAFRSALLFELKSSFRKDMIAFGKNLEHLRVNRLVTRKRKTLSNLRGLRAENLAFPIRWFEGARLIANKIHSDMLVQAFRSRALKDLDDYVMRLERDFQQRVTGSLVELRSRIKTLDSGDADARVFTQPIEPESALQVLKDFEALAGKIIQHTEQLPESSEMMVREETDEVISDQYEILSVPVARMTRHFMESRFLSPTQEAIESTGESVVDVLMDLTEEISLMRFEMENLESRTSVEEIVRGAAKNLERKEKELIEMKDQIVAKIYKNLDDALEPLSGHRILETARTFAQFLRSYQSKKLFDVFGERVEAVREGLSLKTAKLMYSASGGMLMAQKLMDGNFPGDRTQKLLDLVESVSPGSSVLQKIPHFYKSLFSHRSYISEDYWVDMNESREAFQKAIHRYRSGLFGGIAVTGERNSGKTTLCVHVLRKEFKRGRVFHIFPPAAGSLNEDDFKKVLRNTTGIYGEVDEILSSLPHGSVMVIHDLELWWEGSPKGLSLVKQILGFMNRYSRSCLFVVNLNVFSFELLNNLVRLGDHILGVVHCVPFDAYRLKELILKRHQSSGVGFRLNNRSEKDFSQIAMADLFNDFFTHSRGNPGVALNLWLAGARDFRSETLHIIKPVGHDPGALRELENQQLTVLQQICLHKRMGVEKIARVFGMDAGNAEESIRPLRLSGVLTEKVEGVFIINPFLEPHVVKVLRLLEML